MSEMMEFPKTIEEFMEQYKMVDTEEVYSNGTEYVPIFRMKQWFEHERAERGRELIAKIKFGINATNADDVYSCGMRNGMRWVLSLIDGKEPSFEQMNRTCAECKYYTEEHLCVYWSYFGFDPEDYCGRWEGKE